MWFSFRLFLTAIRLLPRARGDLLLENLALRHQLAVYARSRRRPPLRDTDRRFWSTLARSWAGWRDTLAVVQPDTVVRWHRTAWRRYWTWKSRRRGPGRSRISAEVQALIRRMARENPRWGTVRIVGELQALGIDVSASTVRSYRRRAAARSPVPELALLPAAACPGDLGGRLLHGADADLPHAPRLRPAQSWPAPDRALERDRPSHCPVGVAPDHPGDALEHDTAVPDPRPRPKLRPRLRAQGGGDRYRDSAHADPSTAGKRFGRTSDRDHPPRMSRPPHRHQRAASSRRTGEYISYYNTARPHRSLGLRPPSGPRELPPSSVRDRVVAEPVLGGLHHVYRWGCLRADGVSVPHSLRNRMVTAAWPASVTIERSSEELDKLRTWSVDTMIEFVEAFRLRLRRMQ